MTVKWSNNTEFPVVTEVSGNAYIMLLQDGANKKVIFNNFHPSGLQGIQGLSGVPGVTIAGSSGQIQFNDNGVLGGDSSLFWDNTNKNIGIGTSSPLSTLGVTKPNIDINNGVASFFNDTFSEGDFNFILVGKEAGTSLCGVFGYKYSATPENAGAFVCLWGDTPGDGLFIRKGNNVGVGTTLPTEKLQVNGGIRSTSVVIDNSANCTSIDFYGNESRLLGYGPDTSTLGNVAIGLVSSDGSVYQEPIVASGNAVFINNLLTTLTSPSNSLDTDYLPDATHPTMVVASVNIATNAITGSGRVEVYMDSSNPPTTLITMFDVGSPGLNITSPISFVVPKNNYYRLQTSVVDASVTLLTITETKIGV